MFSGPGILAGIVTCLGSHDKDLSADCRAAKKTAHQYAEPKAMFDTPFTNINDQGVQGMFCGNVTRKIVDTLKQINRNADVA